MRKRRMGLVERELREHQDDMQWWFGLHANWNTWCCLYGAANEMLGAMGSNLAFSERWPEIMSEAIEAAEALSL